MLNQLFKLTAVIAIISTAVFAADFTPLKTPIMTYSGGIGFTKYSVSYFSRNMLSFVPLDFTILGSNVNARAVLAYGFDSDEYYDETLHTGDLYVPVTFKVANIDPLRLGVGFELTSFNVWDELAYEAMHTLGPRFSLIIPIPYMNSFNEFGFGIGFGSHVYNYDGYSQDDFIADINISEKLNFMFSDKFGMIFHILYLENIAGGLYDELGAPSRLLLYFGPVINL